MTTFSMLKKNDAVAKSNNYLQPLFFYVDLLAADWFLVVKGRALTHTGVVYLSCSLPSSHFHMS